MRVRTIAVVVCALLLVACGGGTSSSTSTRNAAGPATAFAMRSYTNRRYGYTLRYPAAYFDVGELSNLPAPVLDDKHFATADVASPIELPLSGLWLTVRVSANPQHVPLDTWAARHPHSASDVVVSGVRRITVDGQPAIQQVEDDMRGPHESSYSVVTYIDRGDRMLSIDGLASSPSGFDAHATEYQAIVDSVSFFTPAATSISLLTTALTVAPNGDLYLANGGLPSWCRVFRLTHGALVTVAGNGTCGFSGDGGPASNAEFYEVGGIAVDAAGDVFLADTANCRVREVAHGVIMTIAGNGTCGFAGDGGPATKAELNGPDGLAVDAQGDLFISDNYNCRVRLVRDGRITTVAGNGSCDPGAGDGGPATAAGIEPTGLALAPDGTLYILDAPNAPEQHTGIGACRVRAVRAGAIETAAGNGCGGLSLADGIPATDASLGLPTSVAVDAEGNLYVGDEFCRVRVVHDGIITTVAGSGWDPRYVREQSCTYRGETGPPTSAQISPGPIAVAPDGTLYIADRGGECRVLRVRNGVIEVVAGSGVCPG